MTRQRRNSDEEDNDEHSLHILEDTAESPPVVPSEKRTVKMKISAKKVVTYAMFSLIVFFIWDAMVRSPEQRIFDPSKSDKFLQWVQENPTKGLVALLLLIAVAVIFMVPIGTPLTVGCGYIYKGAYGWKIGLTVATIVSMGGSALGAICCFLLGRYLMRDQVRQWIKKYPLFDAIDVGK